MTARSYDFISGIESESTIVANSLDDLDGVTITTPTDDQFLRYNGTNWVNETVTLATALEDLTDVDIDNDTVEDGQAVVWDNTSSKWVAGASGDASFKMIADGTADIKIKGGSIKIGDKIFGTYDADWLDDLSIECSSHLDNDRHYVYIDKSTATYDATREWYKVLTTDIYITTNAPDLLDTTRYEPIGRYDANGTIITAITIDPYRVGNSWSNIKLYEAKEVAIYNGCTAVNVTHTGTIIDFSTAVKANSNVTTGTAWKYTAPRNGTYHIDTKVLIGESGVLEGEIYALLVYLNNVLYGAIDRQEIQHSQTMYIPLQGSVDVYLTSGQYIDIRVDSHKTLPMYTGVEQNYVSIHEVTNYETSAIATPNNEFEIVYSSNPSGSTTGCPTGWKRVLENTAIHDGFTPTAASWDYAADGVNTGWQPIVLPLQANNGFICAKTSALDALPWTTDYKLKIKSGRGALVTAIPESMVNKGYNYIINGNFDVWQRGTSSTAADFVADRFKMVYAGTGAAETTSKLVEYSNSVQFSNIHRTVITNGGDATNGRVSIYQGIEDVTKLAGKIVTVSFYGRTTSSSKNIAIELLNYYGVGGTGVDFCTPQQVTFTTSWQKFTKTFVLPSMVGKTLGDNTNQTDLSFWYSGGTVHGPRTNNLPIQTGTFDIAQVKLEIGSQATPFESRLYAEELALCQRYCEVIAPRYDSEFFPIASEVTDNINRGGGVLLFKVEKRTKPTITASSNSHFSLRYYNGSSWVTQSTVTIAYFGTSTVGTRFLVSATGPVIGQYTEFNPASTDARIIINAEL